VHEILANWDLIDRHLLLEVLESLFVNILDSLAEYLVEIAEKCVAKLELYPLSFALKVFELFATLRESITKADFVLFPKLLSWMMAQSCHTEFCSRSLRIFREIVLRAGTEKFGAEIIRTALHIVTENPELEHEILELLVVVAVSMGKNFLVYLPEIKNYVEIKDSHPLAPTILSLENDFPIPDSVRLSLELCSESESPVVEKVREVSTKGIPLCELPLDKEIGNEEWMLWLENYARKVLENSYLHVFGLGDTWITVLPVALALAFSESTEEERDSFRKFLEKLLAQKVPKTVMEVFLSVCEILGFVGFPVILPFASLAQKAKDICSHAFEQFFASSRNLSMVEECPKKALTLKCISSLLQKDFSALQALLNDLQQEMCVKDFSAIDFLQDMRQLSLYLKLHDELPVSDFLSQSRRQQQISFKIGRASCRERV
jgi:hypothetical protein